MDRLLLTCYRDTLHKYQKFQGRFEKRLSNGSFGQIPSHKRTIILTRLSRLRTRIAKFQHQCSLFAAGSTLIATLGANVESYSQGLPVPVKSNFQVNMFTENNQANPALASDTEGDFVIVWQDTHTSSNSHDIYMRRYDASGKSLHTEDILVNTDYTTGRQINPAVAIDADGDFIITWYSQEQKNIYARRYNAQGIAKELASFQINTATISDEQIHISVATHAGGNFTITWETSAGNGTGFDIFFRRFNSDGVPQGNQVQVNSASTGSQRFPEVACKDSGSFIITWQGESIGGNLDIYGRRFKSNGTADGAEFRVNTYTTNSQSSPAIAIDTEGNFVITWSSFGQDGSSEGIYAKQYTDNGTPGGNEFQVNIYTTNSQTNAAVSVDEQGNFVISWASEGQDGSGQGIYGRRFKSDGTADGAEFRVNTYTTNDQSNPAIAVDAIGKFIITWSSTGQDGSNEGIYAQDFTFPDLEQRVNADFIGIENNIATAMDANGNYVVVWRKQEELTNQTSIYGQTYDAQGNPQEDAFKISSLITTADLQNPAIAMDASGNFIVSWESSIRISFWEFERNVYVRRYNASGMPLDQERTVNTTSITSFVPCNARIDIDEEGNFIIVWSKDLAGIFAKKYNASGGSQPEFRVSNIDPGSILNTSNPSVAMDAVGDYVISWETRINNFSQVVYAKRYDQSGTPEGEQFIVDSISNSTGTKSNPVVAMDAAGNFVITYWDTDFGGSQTLNGLNVLRVRYDADGRRLDATAVLVNENWRGVGKNNRYPDIAMDSNGNFTIVWSGAATTSPFDGSCSAVIAKRYNSSGQAISQEFLINSYTNGNQDSPAIAMNAAGNFVIAWRSENHCQPGQTNVQKGVFHRLFQLPTNITLSTLSVSENQAGATVGSFTTTDATNGDIFTYAPAIATDNTDDDNNSFIIENNLLKLKPTVSFNFEVKSAYRVRIRVTDASGLFMEKAFLITVSDVNEAPTTITLSANKVFENRPVETVVGDLTTSDPDAGDTHSYSLVTGTGSEDNGSFLVENKQLKTNISFNYEAKKSYSVRIRTADAGGLPFDKVFTIEILNVNDTPTLDNIPNKQLTMNDPAQNIFLSGISSGGETAQMLTVTATTDNTELIKNMTITYTSPNEEGNLTFSLGPGKSGTAVIKVKVTDNGGTANNAINFTEKSFTVNVLGVPSAPKNLQVTVSNLNPMGQIDLIWNDVEEETGYQIQVAVGNDADSSFVNIDPGTEANDTTFSHTIYNNAPLQPSTMYFYRIRAINVAGSSLPSEVVGAVTADSIITTIENQINLSQVKLYPNPATDYVVMDLSAFSDLSITSASLAIYTAKGQPLWSEAWTGKTPLIIPVSHWKPGSYQLVLSVGKRRITKSFIKY